MNNKPGKTATEIRIIEAAADLFAQNGYKGTSTRDISRSARVNEVTLFRYFPHKADLFCAAAESRFSKLRMGRELQSKLAADESPSVTVPLLTEFLLKNFFGQTDLLPLMLVAGFEVPGAERLVREYVGPFFDAVQGYFQRCAAKGMIGSIEPSVATLSLAGVVSAHHSFYKLFTGQELEWSPEEAAPAYANFLLGALKYRPAGGADNSNQ